jgi:hypothetical protein
MALEQDWFLRTFDGSKKVVVYVPDGFDSVTISAYYDTVSAANTAAASVDRARVAINWWHPDVVRVKVGPVQHTDAREDLPAWIDADPAY